MNRIAVFTGSRSEYGLLHSTIRALVECREFNPLLIIAGGHLQEEFGNTIKEINIKGLDEVKIIDAPQDNIKSPRERMLDLFSKILTAGAKIIAEVDPDIILLAGDRYETYAMSIAAFYSNLPVAHMFGGDLSQGGHLDDSVRHSLTKLAHIHFVTNEDSYRRVISLGEEPWRVHNVGSPVLDNIMDGEIAGRAEVYKALNLDSDKPVILFTQHPVTTESEKAYWQVRISLEALKELNLQTVITYPNSDPGSELIIKAIKEFEYTSGFRIVKNLGWRLYLGCMQVASCVVGNSSSGLMETPFFKVPFVNIGSRQAGRLRAENVIDADYDKEKIKKSIIFALYDKDFADRVQSCNNPYGKGRTAEAILRVLSGLPQKECLLKKKMTY